ncbi:MAG: carboxypeptidase-like regulatory domain-containing protein [Kofleriaceae bacterium]|nr:carboxypeptidase-like regulatory domain-containing protein [Kofleriaceae bacterium]
MRVAMLALAACAAIGCGPSSTGRPDSGEGDIDACVGLGCRVVNDCAARGKPETTLSGTVFAPNGTLALFGATVYVPFDDPGPLQPGVQCERCQTLLPGGSVADTTSDAAGKFTLTRVPSGRNVPVVIQIGKWRRKVDIPEVLECTDNPIPANLTSLPKNKNEGDIPKIAVVTGNCDALECLIKKLGVSPSEFTSASGDGRVHLYTANGANSLQNGTMLTPASDLTLNLDKLKEYDIAMFSCECSPNPLGKPQQAMDNMKAFADAGGRIFLSHYNNIWIDGERGLPSHAPQVWPAIATCEADEFPEVDGHIEQVDNPKGAAFAMWMQNVMGSSVNGIVPIESGSGRTTCTSIDKTKATRWVYFQEGSQQYPQNFQFTTPNEAGPEARCGRVVFSDMHVSSSSTSSAGTGFPMGCSSDPLTPQEKALAFMFFDISSCVGQIF